MPTPNWSNTARDDLKEIGRYIGQQQHRPSVAANVMREIRDHCEHLAGSANAGTARPDLGERIRVTSCKQWVIVFRPSTDGIDVLPIVDGSRDWANLF